MTAGRQVPRDPDGADVIALVQTIGLRGFTKVSDRQPGRAAAPAPSRGSDDGADVVAMLQAIGIRGFVPARDATGSTDESDLSTADGGDVVSLVRRLGLRGFTPAPAVSSKQLSPTPAIAPVVRSAVSRTTADVRPAAAAPALPTPSRVALVMPAESKLSKGRFLQIAVAPGGEAAMAALEAKLGMSITGAQSQKLTRTVAGGGEIRAFLLPGDVDSESKIGDVLGQLGDPALTASMGPIDLSQFAMTGGSGGKPWPPQLRPGVIAGLRRVLAR